MSEKRNKQIRKDSLERATSTDNNLTYGQDPTSPNDIPVDELKNQSYLRIALWIVIWIFCTKFPQPEHRLSVFPCIYDSFSTPSVCGCFQFSFLFHLGRKFYVHKVRDLSFKDICILGLKSTCCRCWCLKFSLLPVSRVNIIAKKWSLLFSAVITSSVICPLIYWFSDKYN